RTLLIGSALAAMLAGAGIATAQFPWTILPGRRSRPSKTGRGYKALGGPRRSTRVPGIRPKLETRTGKAKQTIAPPLGTPKNTEPTDEQARQQAAWTASATHRV